MSNYKKILDIKFIKFAFVGGAGTITNLVIFYVFVDRFNFNPTFISSLAFIVAVTQNYFSNHYWTFKENTGKQKPGFKNYLKFVIVSLSGLFVNLVVLNILLYFIVFKYKVIAQGIGILAGLFINFAGSKRLVFK